jgi:oxygen-independent coproporphyrinogen III oxidase
VVDSERLGKEAAFRESVVMGLRMVIGISCQDLYDHYGLNVDEYYGESLDWLKRNLLIERTPSHLRLTARGRQVANSVMARLV